MIRRSTITILGAACIIGGALALSGCSNNPDPAQRPVNMERVVQIREAISEGTGGPVVAATRPDPTGWATLKGTFKFTPAAAASFTTQPNLAITGDDAAYCNQGGAPKSKALLVKPTGEIANIVIFLGDDLSKVQKPEVWIHPSQAPGSKTDEIDFDQDKCVFLSPVTTMQVSQPLKILNSDGVGHNTKLENSNQISEIIPPGGSLTYQHRKEERAPYPVSCNIHPWMRAFILVRSNGYFAQTDENGAFEIQNLPAGVDLTMKVWHEKVGFLQDVTVNGTAVKWAKKGFTQKLPAGGETTLDVVVGAGPFGN